jgi:tripartite-type tricarboxylate transporter receptor subunit TctC
VTTMPLLIVSHPSVPVSSVPELITYAKANPDRLSYGTPGTGTPHHLAMELFKSAAGVKIAHVPYKGTGPGVSDILGGHIPLLVATPAPIQQQVQKAQLRALGSMDRNRLADFKNVAAISETLPGFEVAIWHGVFVPAGTPPAIAQTWSRTLQPMVAEAQFKQQMSAMGVVPRWVAPDETIALMKAERDKWADAIRKAGIQPE